MTQASGKAEAAERKAQQGGCETCQGAGQSDKEVRQNTHNIAIMCYHVTH